MWDFQYRGRQGPSDVSRGCSQVWWLARDVLVRGPQAPYSAELQALLFAFAVVWVPSVASAP